MKLEYVTDEIPLYSLVIYLDIESLSLKFYPYFRFLNLFKKNKNSNRRKCLELLLFSKK